MTQTRVCWKCGAPIEDWPLPLARLAQCRACGAELHVCRLCAFYDARVRGQCTEDRAEEVLDKERANFCDYFKPRPDAYVPRDDRRARAAKAALDSLFGPAPDKPGEDADAVRKRLDELFGGRPKR